MRKFNYGIGGFPGLFWGGLLDPFPTEESIFPQFTTFFPIRCPSLLERDVDFFKDKRRNIVIIAARSDFISNFLSVFRR